VAGDGDFAAEVVFEDGLGEGGSGLRMSEGQQSVGECLPTAGMGDNDAVAVAADKFGGAVQRGGEYRFGHGQGFEDKAGAGVVPGGQNGCIGGGEGGGNIRQRPAEDNFLFDAGQPGEVAGLTGIVFADDG